MNRATIDTVDGVIDALGGTAATSRLCNVTMQAVSNWRAERAIPRSRHLTIYRACQEAGIPVSDTVFEAVKALHGTFADRPPGRHEPKVGH